MSENKNLFRDTRPKQQPEGSYPFAKNGIQNNVKDSAENEPGFRLTSAAIPYKCNGIIGTPKFPVVFSTNGVNSAIGYFDVLNDVYTPIFNDAALPYKLGLNPNFYVTGQAQTNYLGEVVITFTDKDKFPKYLNCDNPQITQLSDFRLFPFATPPVIALSQDVGGALFPGAYYMSVKYAKKDGTETPFLTTSNVHIIPGNAAVITGNSITARLTNCDINYDQIIIAVIIKVNGITTAVELDPVDIPNSGIVQTTYTGGNFSTSITLEEILIPPAVYSKVGSIAQLNDALYLLRLEKEPDVEMQQHALLVELEWVSDLINLNPVPADVLSGIKRGAMHEEVYAFYIQYSLTEGGWSRGFAIAGPSPTVGDLAASALATAQGMTAKRYQVDDTIPIFNATTKTGTPGVWVNENELYPDTIDYDASAFGGRNLRNQPVLHHRMPSVRWCKTNLYPFETEYGKSKFDMLGIRASNIVIPAIYANRINGYRILYAKRSLSNSTVVGQSLLMGAGRKGDPNTNTINSPDLNYMSTAGNWTADYHYSRINLRKPIVYDKKLFKFHSFDLLFNRPAVSPTYLSMQLRHQIDNLANTMLEDHSIFPGEDNGPTVYLCDYLARGNVPTAATSAKQIRKIVESQYIPNNLNSGKWTNIQVETAFGGKLSNDVLDSGDVSYHREYTGRRTFQPGEYNAQKEVTYLCNLMQQRTDVYLPFNSQPLVIAGQSIGLAPAIFYGGDTFVSDYCFHTYGWCDWENWSYDSTIGGIKAVRRFSCESVSNINARYLIPGNDYSKWYPASPLSSQEPSNYITTHRRDTDPNQFGYNRDLNTLNDLLSVQIFNPNIEQLTKFPHRIHRGGKLSRQTKPRSWRTFLPLDYYEMQKNMGPINHGEGMDDVLLIHCENALFVTQDKAKLESGLLSVTLGAGDIFQFEPQEGISAKLGYAGTQHDLACVQTPIGYIFIDSKQGQIFLFKGKVKLMNEGLNNFFREFLKLRDKNIFLGNGYTIGYDPVYKRILVTCKNVAKSANLPGALHYVFEPTSAFMSTLVVNDLVFMNGRWVKYLGVNATAFSCDGPILPIINNVVFTIPENTPNDTLVGTLTGTNIAEAYILNNRQGAFRLDPLTLELFVNNSALLDFETTPQFLLDVIALSSDLNEDTAVVTVNLTNVAEGPVTGKFQFNIAENSANTTVVGTVTGTDPGGLPLTYTITAGNSLGIFAIDSVTGVITVVDNTFLDYEAYSVHELTVNVSNGTLSADATVTILVIDERELGARVDESITIYDTTPTDTVVYELATNGGNDLNDTIKPLFEITGASVPGLFSVNEIGEIILNDNASLNAGTFPQYTLEITVRDGMDPLVTEVFTLTLDVEYDPATLEFTPSGASCGGTTKSWTGVSIYSTRLSAVVTVALNALETYFQSIQLPYYEPVVGHIDCGGAVNHYLSVQKSGSAAKNDCDGLGSVVTFYSPAGQFMSVVSQADADALAQTYVDSSKQNYANTNGECL